MEGGDAEGVEGGEAEGAEGGEAEGEAGGEAESPVWASLDDEARETPSRTPSKTPNHEPKTKRLEPAVGESGPFRALALGWFVDGVLILTECSPFKCSQFSKLRFSKLRLLKEH